MAARRGLIWISCNNHISSNDTQLKTQFLTRFLPFTSLLCRLLLFHSFKCYFSSSLSLIPTAEKRRWQKRKGCLMAARYTMYTKRFYFIVITNIWISNQSKLCVIVVTCCFSHPFQPYFCLRFVKYFFKRQNFSAPQQSQGVASGEQFLEAEWGFKIQNYPQKRLCFFSSIKFILS